MLKHRLINLFLSFLFKRDMLLLKQFLLFPVIVKKLFYLYYYFYIIANFRFYDNY